MFFFYKWDFLLSALLHEPGCGDVYPDIKPSRYRNLRWQGWLGRHVITKVDLLFIHVLYSRACWIGWALFTCSDFGERERERESPTRSRNQAQRGRVLPGFEIWPKYSAGFGKRLWDTGFDFYLRSGIRQNLGTVCQTGKENDIRDGDDRRSGCGILVEKEWKCRTRTPFLDPN